MNDSNLTYLCIRCGRDFRPRDADTVICPDCGGPPQAPAPAQPQGTARIEQPKGTVLAEQPHGTGLMGESTYQRLCIICGQDFAAPDPQADRCPQCRGEAPRPQGEIISKPESAQPTPAMPARAQGTVAAPESSLHPAPSSATDIPLEWNAGDVILDLYEVKGELGKGGMGVVYRVHHRQWNLDLAVKTPLSKALQKAGGLENFIREAQAWVDLGLHPHIVTCYYVRRLGEAPRVFAECMEGGSLKDWIKDGRLYAGGEQEGLKRILDVAIQFAWGLGYAHEKGLVHQDVKPANALMTPDGMLKVTDFGLVGAKGYTEAYAAPEQELGQAVSPRTDIWCWGVSVLEMFTGGVHWQFGSVAANVLENYLQEAPTEGIPPMPAALAELLRQCFQNDPAQRPASMDEVAERLVRLYEQETGTPYPRQKPKALELRADSLNNKAVSLLDLGQEEEAVRCWQEALQADPAHLEANFNYGYYRWHKAELLGSEFLKQLKQLESTHGSNPEYWRLLGWVYLEQGYVEEVEEILEKRGVEDEALRRAHTAPDRPVGRKMGVGGFSSKKLTSIALSPDALYLLLGIKDGDIQLWDITRAKVLRYFKGHIDSVNSVAFSHNGRYALSGSADTTVRLWEVETGREVRRFEGHTDSVETVAFSPDGRYVLSGGWDKTVRVWEVATGHEVRRFKGHTDWVNSVIFSPDGHHALSGGLDGTVRLWEIRSGKERCFVGGHHGYEQIVAFSPDGNYLALSESEGLFITDTTVQLLDLRTGQEVRRLDGHTKNVGAIAFSPDGRYILSGSDDFTVRLWDVSNGREVRCFDAHKPVKWVAFSSNGRLFLSMSKSNMENEANVLFWDIYYPPTVPDLIHLFPLLSSVRSATQLSDERQHALELLQQARKATDEGRSQQAYILLRRVQDLPEYNRDTEVLSLLARCGFGGRRCGTRDAWLACRFEGHNRGVRSVVFSSDGRYFLSGSRDKTVRLWDITTRQEVRRFDRHKTEIKFISFSPDGHYALSGSEDAVWLWEAETGKEVRGFYGHTERVKSVAFSPDGRYLVGGGYGTLRIWNVTTGEEIRYLNGDTYSINSVTFSPDGRYILLGTENTIRLWDFATRKEVCCFKGHKFDVSSVTFSPDGRYILSGSWDRTVRLWEVASCQEVCIFVGHTSWVNSVTFLPDGNYFLSGSGGRGEKDTTVRLWKTRDRLEVYRFEQHTQWVVSVAVSLDGRYALSGGEDSTICLWEFDWDYDFPAPADWDEGARPYLDIFLTLHTPYARDGLRRVGKPQWTEEDFQKLLQELGYRGYGWLRPEGVRRELEKMAKERK